MQGLPVRLGEFTDGLMDGRRIETPLKGFVIKINRQRPGEPGGGRSIDRGIHGAFADTAGCSCITPALVA